MFDCVLNCLFLLILIRSITHDFRRYYPLNPFSTNVPFLNPLKTSENLWFSDIFRGFSSGTLVGNGLKLMLPSKREITINWFTLQINYLYRYGVNIDHKGAKEMRSRKFEGALSGMRQETSFSNWMPFKNNEKYFLPHLKSYFRSQSV